MAPAAEIIEDEERLEELRRPWDDLAVSAGQPFSSPAWMLAWWRHARPANATLRAVAVFDAGQLVGIAPIWLSPPTLGRREQRLLGARLGARASPLAAPGREGEVAAAIASALADAPGAGIVRLESQGGAPDWPSSLARAWPGRRPWLHSASPVPAPVVTLEGLDYESWLSGKSASFRREARRVRRRLEKAGASFSIAGPDEVEDDVAAFIGMHEERWRGGSSALIVGLSAMLREVASELVPSGRFRLYRIEAGGRPISVTIQLAAGGEVSSWNSGFDQRWADYSPGSQGLLHSIGDAMERGDRCLDLGPGDQHYKLRLADTERMLDTVTLVARDAAYPLDRARLARYQLRWAVSRRLEPETKQRLRRLARR